MYSNYKYCKTGSFDDILKITLTLYCTIAPLLHNNNLIYRHCFRSFGLTIDRMDQYTSRLHPPCSVCSGILQTAERKQVEVAFPTHCITTSWNCFSPVSSSTDPWSGGLFFTGHKIPSHYLLSSWTQEHLHLHIPV